MDHHMYSHSVLIYCNLGLALILEILAQEILSALQVKQEWHWTVGGVW